jgi:hypothetical protein
MCKGHYEGKYIEKSFKINKKIAYLSMHKMILSRARLPVPPHGLAAPSISEGWRAGQKENRQAPGSSI